MNKELAKTIGTAARQARKNLQLTQEDVAERIDVSVEFYARIERGTSLPSILTFVRIVSALGVSADALLGQQFAASPVAASWMPTSTTDSADVRRVVRRIRKARPATLRLVNLLLKELERRADAHASASPSNAATQAPTAPAASPEVADQQSATDSAPVAAADANSEASQSTDERLVAASKALETSTPAPGMRSISSPRTVFSFNSTAQSENASDAATH